MAIKLGSTAINKMYLGSTEAKKAYLGSTLILDNTAATPFGGHATLANDIIFYLKCDGDALDATGNGHNGTVNGSTLATGVINQGYNQDGTNDYINLGDNDAFSFTDGAGNDEPFSYQYWIDINSTVGTRSGFSKWGSSFEYYDLIRATGQYDFVITDSANDWIGRQTSTGAISSSGFHHIVATYDGSNSSTGIKIYIDGVRADTANNSNGTYNGMSNTPQPLDIGRRSTIYASGVQDEVAMWSRELTASEVSDLYNSGSGLQY